MGLEAMADARPREHRDGDGQTTQQRHGGAADATFEELAPSCARCHSVVGGQVRRDRHGELESKVLQVRLRPRCVPAQCPSEREAPRAPRPRSTEAPKRQGGLGHERAQLCNGTWAEGLVIPRAKRSLSQHAYVLRYMLYCALYTVRCAILHFDVLYGLTCCNMVLPYTTWPCISLHSTQSFP